MSAERCDQIFHLTPDMLKAHWAAFAPAYYGTDSQEVLGAEIRKLCPYAATKVAFLVSKLHDGKGAPSEALMGMFDRMLPEN